MLEGIPGIDLQNGEVRFEAPDFAAAYRGAESLIRVSDLTYNQVLYDVIRKRPQRTEIFTEFLDTLVRQGLGEMPLKAEPVTDRARGQRYFGEQ